jgi:hypothetical protein
MVFPKVLKPSKRPTAKGVAIFGPRQWPNNIIPYDLSDITCKSHLNNLFYLLYIIYFFVASSDQAIFVDAINTLMYAVGTPIEGETSRQPCVYFRPRLSNDENFVKITYGDGCSGTVNNLYDR